MPNWVTNELVITGEKEVLTKFMWSVKEVNEEGKELMLDLDSLLPMPKELLDRPAGDFWADDNWYGWRCIHWGTKSNASDSTRQQGYGTLLYKFFTAWSPPVPWLTTVSKQFTNLKFELEFVDEMMNFRGRYVVINGEEQERESFYDNEVNLTAFCNFDDEDFQEEMKEYWGDDYVPVVPE
jgi:Ferredoxin-like domain in Api92-like protein